jgi:hypothetical protein
LSGTEATLKLAVINAGGNFRDGNLTITLPPGLSYVSSKTFPDSVGSPRQQDQTIFWEDLDIDSQKNVKFDLKVRIAKSVSGQLDIVSYFNDLNAGCATGPHITEVSFERPFSLPIFSIFPHCHSSDTIQTFLCPILQISVKRKWRLF